MKVLIIGSGISGRSASEFLENLGIEVAFAKQEEINSEFAINDEQKDRLFGGLSFIVKSPGISYDLPIIKEAKKRHIKIVGEFELGSTKLLGDIVAITGTNGKTTTVSLIHYLLKDADARIFLGGNIGIPVTRFAAQTKSTDISVLECSSYQLESTKYFHPHIAAILNLTPDHLNRHKTMQRYILAKYKITKNQTEDDYLLLNADDDKIMQNPPKTRAKIYYFSTKHRVFGCYLKRGCIYFNDNQIEKKLVSLKGIRLIGEHNLSNILCATLAVWLETKDTKLLKNISGFVGVPHRTEYVKTINGVSFFNDSKATNISSTIVATKSFKQNICLILGGSDKGYEFDELFKNLPKNVKLVAVCGATKQKIIDAAKRQNYKNIYVCLGLKDATNLCYLKADKNDIVLLSPACASFDAFTNYEERGTFFKRIVEEISISENVLGKTEEKIQV